MNVGRARSRRGRNDRLTVAIFVRRRYGGIEATEAINRDYVAATMHPKARQPSSLVDPSLYKWVSASRSPKQIADEAGQTELTGDGWVGDSVEHEFAAMVADIVSREDRRWDYGEDR